MCLARERTGLGTGPTGLTAGVMAFLHFRGVPLRISLMPKPRTSDMQRMAQLSTGGRRLGGHSAPPVGSTHLALGTRILTDKAKASSRAGVELTSKHPPGSTRWMSALH